MSLLIKKKYGSRHKSRKHSLKTKKYILRGGQGKEARVKTSEPAPKDRKSFYGRIGSLRKTMFTPEGRAKLLAKATNKASQLAASVSNMTKKVSTPEQMQQAVATAVEKGKQFRGSVVSAVTTPEGQNKLVKQAELIADRLDAKVANIQEKLGAVAFATQTPVGRQSLGDMMKNKLSIFKNSIISKEQRKELGQQFRSSSLGQGFAGLKQKIKGATHFVQKRALEEALERAEKKNPEEAAQIRAELAALKEAPVEPSKKPVVPPRPTATAPAQILSSEEQKQALDRAIRYAYEYEH